MKRILAAAITITACAALCAAVWPRNSEVVMPTEAENRELGVCVDGLSQSTVEEASAFSDDTPVTLAAESVAPEPVEITAEKEESPAESVPIETTNHAAPETPEAVSAPTPQSATPAATDPYHTDVYPNNVYSEEFIYDKDGNLIGKTTTIPTEFGPDAIWIDGSAYYDVPGFGLVEWSGPGQRTEDYTMYESGVKVGIMGGEDEVPTHRTPTSPPLDWPEPSGEVIDQTINTKPERNNTPPAYKPETTPPAE